MKRELLPELDDQTFWDIIDGLKLLKTEVTVEPRSLPARLPKAPSLTEVGEGKETLMFQELVWTMTEPTITSLTQALQEGQRLGLELKVRELLHQLRHHLANQFTDFTLRALIKHLRQRVAAGTVSGQTPEQRYQEYCHTWWEEHAANFYETYPVLSSLQGLLSDQCVQNLIEVLHRIHQHRQEICALVGTDESLEIVGLAFQGDRHNGGKTACVIALRQGKVVYKPRSVDGEKAYHQLVAWLNGKGAGPMAAAKVIAAAGYGFMEYIPHDPVAPNDKRFTEFLEKTGELSAVLHALQANDMHFENIHVHNAMPIPIDMETLLHPVNILQAGQRELPLPGNAYQQLAMGVAASGILPSRIQGKNEERGYVDVGFLHGDSTGNPFAGLLIKNPFRDDAHVGFTQPTNSFTADEDVEAVRTTKAKIASAVAAGFARRYRWLMEHRDEFLSVAIEYTRDATLRAVLQPTLRYAQLLRMLGSPEALMSAEVFQTVSLRTLIFGSERPLELVSAEAHSLQQLEVPFFITNANTLEVRSGTTTVGSQATVGLTLAETPQQLMVNKILAMDEKQLEEQLVQIWSSFVSGYPADTLSKTIVPQAGGTVWGLRRRREELMTDLADHLVDTMSPGTRAQDPWTWLAPVPGTSSHDSAWATQVLTPELYSGSLGPALALVSSAQHTGQQRYRDAAHRVLEPVAALAAQGKTDDSVPDQNADSVFLGEPGTVFALKQAGEILAEPAYVAAATTLAEATLERLNGVQQPTADFLTGQVGAVSTLLSIGLPLKSQHQQQGLALLARHVDDVLEHRVDSAWWDQSGYAHGIAATLAVLSIWGDQLPNPARAATARDAVAERLEEFIDPERGTWSSRASHVGRERTAWCHGSAGIALALAAAQHWAPQTVVAPERLAQAVQHTLDHGLGRNLTFCHGDAGAIEILRWVATVTGNSLLQHHVDDISHQYTPEIIRRVLADRSNRYSLTPSYMVGLSGVLTWLAHLNEQTTDFVTPIFPGLFAGHNLPEVS